MNFIIALFFSINLVSFAESDSLKKTIHLEWEKIPEAFFYQAEIKSLKNDLPGKIFKTKDNFWDGKIIPGQYKFRLRSLDHRGVPGEWSDFQELTVWLETPEWRFPDKEKIISSSEIEEEINLEWSHVPGAIQYELIVLKNSEILSQDLIQENSKKVKLPVANNYEFKIKAISDAKIESEKSAEKKLLLFGKKILPSEIVQPENEFVRSLHWSTPPFVENFDLKLEKKSALNSWAKVLSSQTYKKNQIEFPAKLPGGHYKLSMTSQAPLRESSPPSEIEFDVKQGERSLAAENLYYVRKSIENLNGVTLLASYMISQLNYSSSYTVDNYLAVMNLKPLGGTFRGGVGYHPKGKSFGYIGFADFSGFRIENTNYTYAALEGNFTYQNQFSDFFDLRFEGGVAVKELPQVFQDTSLNKQVQKVFLMAPHIGAEAWYALSQKYGIQLNAQGYYNLFKIQTPNGKSLIPTISYQFGVLGSYFWKKNIKFYLGYTNRFEQVKYNSSNSISNDSLIVGQYLSTGAQWIF